MARIYNSPAPSANKGRRPAVETKTDTPASGTVNTAGASSADDGTEKTDKEKGEDE